MVSAYPLARGVDYVDLHFQGEPGINAAGLIHGADGLVLVDPGPATCFDTLEAGLAAHGFRWRDVRAVLLTHIHLDHAGASGHILRAAPAARLYVHEYGRRHMVDPSRLLASATRLYRNDMARLWGTMLPVPPDRVERLGLRDSLSIVGHEIQAAWTPGHAIHHVSYFLPALRLAFVGDTAGICRQAARVILPPTPPPDIDLEAWRRSTETILGWNPETLFLTHFGPYGSPSAHFDELWQRMDEWSEQVRASLHAAGTDEARAADFSRRVQTSLDQWVSESEAYAHAGQFHLSWMGLARYWRTRLTS